MQSFLCSLQVMSHSVAAALHTLIDLGTIGEEARATAEFIEMFNQMFDCFNSNSISSSTPYKGAFNDKHLPFLKECKTWLSSVKCANGNQLPCLNGWKQNINAFEMMWEDMKGKY